MLKQRVITAAIGVPLIIAAVWFGNPWFSLLIAAVVLLSSLEFYRMVAQSGEGQPLTYFGLLFALALALSPLSLHYKNTDMLPLTVALGIVISLLWLLCRSPREGALRSWAWTIAGALYVGWMLSYWVNLRLLDEGAAWVYLAVLTTFANDTGAFFVGRRWGKRKLASSISPRKTWEGAIGGLLSGIAGAFIVFAILNVFSPLPLSYWQLILLGFLVSLFAQLGDLVESLLKRNLGAGESGKLLPGHGGILDRFDSLIFTGVVVYYCAICVV
jgi:phosphatidate cytidylyltransferase